MLEARREANAVIAAAQKSAQELRDADIAATRDELGRLRDRATADIQAERDRALADLRAQVADLALAAAGKLVGENDDRRPSATPRRQVPRRSRRQHRRPEQLMLASAPGGATPKRPSSSPLATGRSTRGSATWPSPPGWPATSG